MDKFLPEWVFKYGASGVMAVWLFNMSVRLREVENRLYDCWEYKKYYNSNIATNNNEDNTETYYQNITAVLNTDRKYKYGGKNDENT